MNAQHTPGPWTIETRFKTAINSGMKHIALVNFYNSKEEETRVNEEEHQANVRLIATAPELLAALEDFVQDYLKILNSGDNGTWDPMTDTVYVNACAAINKAKGQ